MSTLIETAIKATRAARDVTTHYFRRELDVTLKDDLTPVTVADRESERIIIQTIRAAYPDHSFLGEETGRTSAGNDYLWVIDPIDGTKNFIAGIPLWGTLLALVQRHEVIVAVADLPLMNETLWAQQGMGAYLNDQKIHVSTTDNLTHAMISFGSLGSFRERGIDRSLLSLVYKCRRQRCFGDLWPYALLASARLEIVVEASIHFHDVAPFVLIIKEAGGYTSDLFGNPVGYDSTSFLATNGRLHQAALEHFPVVANP